MNHWVAAEIVANVLSVEVQPGDKVRPGDTILLLESMKMEIPVISEVAGTVSEVVVEKGHVVHDGDPMVLIEAM